MSFKNAFDLIINLIYLLIISTRTETNVVSSSYMLISVFKKILFIYLYSRLLFIFIFSVFMLMFKLYALLSFILVFVNISI